MLNLKAYIVQCQKLVSYLARMVFSGYFELGVRLAPKLRPPTGNIFAEHSPTDIAETIGFRDILN